MVGNACETEKYLTLLPCSLTTKGVKSLFNFDMNTYSCKHDML